MENEKFGELLNALRIIKSLGSVEIDALKILNDADLTPEQLTKIQEEFSHPRKERSEPLAFDYDYST
jgi:hypothetical protein